MPAYVSMLRGINVGGGKTIKMERLRAAFEALSFFRVRTYAQAGMSFLKPRKVLPQPCPKGFKSEFCATSAFPSL